MSFIDDIQKGMQLPQSVMQSYYSPQMNQLAMLQQQAKLDQLKGLDPVSQQNIAASQANVDLSGQQEQRLQEKAQQEAQEKQVQFLGALASAGLNLPEDQRDSFFNTVGGALGINPDEMTPENIKNFATLYQEANKKDVQIQQVSGMPGYYFDPNDKENPFKLDQRMGADLINTQNQLKNKDKWDVDTKEKINSKVTPLVKPAIEITDAAKSLESLRGRGSSASKLAAVFKFMKALDPASVVREGEQEQVRKTGGITDAIAGLVLKAQGQGAFTDEIFEDIVMTAKTLSNSAIDSANQSVSGFIDVFDTMPQSTYKNLMNRIPKKFDTKETANIGRLPSGIAERMSPEQLKVYNNFTDEEKKRFEAALKNDNSGTSGQAKRFK